MGAGRTAVVAQGCDGVGAVRHQLAFHPSAALLFRVHRQAAAVAASLVARHRGAVLPHLAIDRARAGLARRTTPARLGRRNRRARLRRLDGRAGAEARVPGDHGGQSGLFRDGYPCRWPVGRRGVGCGCTAAGRVRCGRGAVGGLGWHAVRGGGSRRDAVVVLAGEREPSVALSVGLCALCALERRTHHRLHDAGMDRQTARSAAPQVDRRAIVRYLSLALAGVHADTPGCRPRPQPRPSADAAHRADLRTGGGVLSFRGGTDPRPPTRPRLAELAVRRWRARCAQLRRGVHPRPGAATGRGDGQGAQQSDDRCGSGIDRRCGGNDGGAGHRDRGRLERGRCRWYDPATATVGARVCRPAHGDRRFRGARRAQRRRARHRRGFGVCHRRMASGGCPQDARAHPRRRGSAAEGVDPPRHQRLYLRAAIARHARHAPRPGTRPGGELPRSAALDGRQQPPAGDGGTAVSERGAGRLAFFVGRAS